MRYEVDLADEYEIAEDLRGIRDSLGRLKRKWKGRTKTGKIRWVWFWQRQISMNI